MVAPDTGTRSGSKATVNHCIAHLQKYIVDCKRWVLHHFCPQGTSNRYHEYSVWRRGQQTGQVGNTKESGEVRPGEKTNWKLGAMCEQSCAREEQKGKEQECARDWKRSPELSGWGGGRNQTVQSA